MRSGKGKAILAAFWFLAGADWSWCLVVCCSSILVVVSAGNVVLVLFGSCCLSPSFL